MSISSSILSRQHPNLGYRTPEKDQVGLEIGPKQLWKEQGHLRDLPKKFSILNTIEIEVNIDHLPLTKVIPMRVGPTYWRDLLHEQTSIHEDLMKSDEFRPPTGSIGSKDQWKAFLHEPLLSEDEKTI